MARPSSSRSSRPFAAAGLTGALLVTGPVAWVTAARVDHDLTAPSAPSAPAPAPLPTAAATSPGATAETAALPAATVAPTATTQSAPDVGSAAAAPTSTAPASEPSAPPTTASAPIDQVGSSWGTVTFTSNSAALTGPARAALRSVARRLVASPGVVLRISGHADTVGTPAANRALSEKRARVVSAFLVAAGVPETRLRVSWFGQARPVASNSTPAGRAANRRVELVTESPGTP